MESCDFCNAQYLQYTRGASGNYFLIHLHHNFQDKNLRGVFLYNVQEKNKEIHLENCNWKIVVVTKYKNINLYIPRYIKTYCTFLKNGNAAYA